MCLPYLAPEVIKRGQGSCLSWSASEASFQVMVGRACWAGGFLGADGQLPGTQKAYEHQELVWDLCPRILESCTVMAKSRTTESDQHNNHIIESIIPGRQHIFILERWASSGCSSSSMAERGFVCYWKSVGENELGHKCWTSSFPYRYKKFTKVFFKAFTGPWCDSTYCLLSFQFLKCKLRITDSCWFRI